MRNRGVEVDRRALREIAGTPGLLTIMVTNDQGLNRPCKVARLTQGELVRAVLKDVEILWMNDDRFTLTGFKRVQNDAGQMVDFRQSWLLALDTGPALSELTRAR